MRGFLLFLALAGLLPATAAAQAGCRFELGFATLRERLGADRVGACLEDEAHDTVAAETRQRTTRGTLVWRKSANETVFIEDRPEVPVAAEEVVRGDPSRPWISLVFNAGSGYRTAYAIPDILKAKGVRTTFFPLGWWVEQEAELVRRIAADGHEVASHGHSVFDLTAVSDREVIADLTRAEDSISAVTGRTTKPLWSPSAGYRDARVRSLAASIGYRPIFWTLDSGDWRFEATGDGVRRRVLEGAVNGAIIVMHTDSPRTADSVAPVLGDLIDQLRERGFRLVTVSELVTGTLRP